MAQSKYPVMFLVHFFSVSTELCVKAEIKKDLSNMIHIFSKAKSFQEAAFFIMIYTYLHVKNSHGVLERRVLCIF